MTSQQTTTVFNREQLILAHMPQVRLLANHIHARCPQQVDVEDLISAGVVGLIQAIDRFDPNRHCLLKTLADHRIRGAILDYLRQEDPLPRAIRQFAKQREAAQIRLEFSLGRRPDELELADALDLPISRYRTLDRIVRAALPLSIEDVLPSKTRC
jgi:RNA polymerase sigma factor for flagellar operon FliA